MQDYELDAYLGPRGQVDDYERQQIRAAANAIGARYPEQDLEDSRQLALSAAVQVILGTDPGVIVAAWHDARLVEQDAHAALTGALIAVAPGVPETILATRFHLNRATVRKALGKRPRT